MVSIYLHWWPLMLVDLWRNTQMCLCESSCEINACNKNILLLVNNTDWLCLYPERTFIGCPPRSMDQNLGSFNLASRLKSGLCCVSHSMTFCKAAVSVNVRLKRLNPLCLFTIVQLRVISLLSNWERLDLMGQLFVASVLAPEQEGLCQSVVV